MLLAASLAACGGGGGSAGTAGGAGGTGGTGGTGGSGDSTGGSTSTVASFIYQLSKSALTNSGSDSTVLTVTALDANNNPVSGATVGVAVDTGVYTPATTVTDTKGQTSGAITIGANKGNRNITATITVNGLTAKAVIAVTGAAISLTPVPATPAPGASTRIDVKVTDATGAGVPSVPVTLSGSLGLSTTVTTDSTGSASATLGAAPVNPGSYTVDAAALGVEATRTVQVVSGAGGGIPGATGPITSASLSVVPTTIAPNTAGSTTNQAQLRAKFLNGANQAIQNVRVRFEIVAPGLGSGEAISTSDATVYSDVNGEAIASYVAGTRSSPTNGVVIRACYGLDDVDIANGACANFQTQTLTVAGQPLSITLGDNNELAKGANNLTYIKKFDVAVADSAGNAVANAIVSASVDITHYGKGNFTDTNVAGTSTYQVTGNNPPNASTQGISITATPTANTGRVWCPNEDTNRNGSIDLGEDINNDNKLEPRKADVILSFLGSNTTGTNGRLAIQVEYPQNVATWLSYTVKVTTNVAGSEGTDQKSYITSFVAGDEVNGSFLTPPYGANRCVDAN
jgi:hypothetical protein